VPVGSGKLGTPCERIQEEYARSPAACAVPPPGGLAVVVVETAGTPVVDGPPQAAIPTPTARIPAARAARRG
jgi:hypothetical protein